jgi:hypothetical protein
MEVVVRDRDDLEVDTSGHSFSQHAESFVGELILR